MPGCSGTKAQASGPADTACARQFSAQAHTSPPSTFAKQEHSFFGFLSLYVIRSGVSRLANYCRARVRSDFVAQRGSKLTVTIVSISTSSPLSSNGFQRHCFTAFTTASATIGSPLSTFTLEGFPLLSTPTLTATVPNMAAPLGSAGIVGRTIFRIFAIGGLQI